ncbi:MAG: Gfo/Idh/MocA family oxidoreductase, partial [Acidobacteria bacterium]|nr:Gfo/Idh/MocA family oxidoreductase [Acidobacteriota bacterium]
SAAVAAGKHVFCEKPFSIGIADARTLLDTANDGGQVFQVGHNRRFAPVYTKLRELLRSDSAHSAHIKMNRGELKNPAWTGDVNVTGGFLYETTIHLFDMLRFQFGEIAELVAYGSQHEYPELDEFSIIFKFDNGFHCTFASSSDASWHFPFERIEVFCHHRTIITEEMERLFDSRGMDANFETVSFHMTEKDERWGYVQEDRAFIDAIVDEKEPPVTALDGFKSVELVESVYAAISDGESKSFA